MKVMAWYSCGVYPLDLNEENGLCTLSFRDEDGKACDRVLLTGVSGVGKSRMLSGMRDAWAAMEAWLDGAEPTAWSGEIALLIDGLLDRPALCVCARGASFWEAVCAACPDAAAIGWVGGEARGLELPGVAALRARRAGSAQSLPNLLLTGQAPVRIQDEMGLDEALAALWAQDAERARAMLGALGRLLYGKRIELDGGRAQVRLERGGAHALAALSSGEQRVVAQMIEIARALHHGGVLLADEPEMHLHPSQVLGLLTTLEQLVLPSGGQIVLTSHTPEVWRRYNNLGVNVMLEGRA